MSRRMKGGQNNRRANFLKDKLELDPHTIGRLERYLKQGMEFLVVELDQLW